MAPWENSSNRTRSTATTYAVILLLLAILAPFLARFLKNGSSGSFARSMDPVVETPVGRIEGFQEELGNKKVNVYFGIPYAEPPVGDRRFKYPVPAKPRELINATEFSGSCPSRSEWLPNAKYSEDCLYLNIWCPATYDKNLKPVMVWIHGGGFFSGSANTVFYNGLTLVANEDVVLVSINYRVGVLGFLSLGQNSDVPGNMGLMDQALAIQWVKNYIHLFGGDPEKITLFGQSAGGFSVAFHLVSPVTRNLFKRAIVQSGAVYGDLGEFNVKEYLKISNIFMEKLGCGIESNPDQIRCLQEVNLSKIINTQYAMLMEQMIGLFGPTLDKIFLPKPPVQLLQEGEIGQGIQEIMIGVTSDEGTVFMPLVSPKKFARYDNPIVKEEEAKTIMNGLFNGHVNPSNKSELSEFYLSKFSERYKAVYESYGDLLIMCPAVYSAEELANNDKKVYFYEFAHRSNVLIKLLATLIGQKNNAASSSVISLLNAPWMGVRHAEEIIFVFGMPVRYGNLVEFPEDEIELSRRMMNTWATFAKTGKPPRQLDQEWPLYTKENPRYLRLKSQEAIEEIGFHAESCEKWRPHIVARSFGNTFPNQENPGKKKPTGQTNDRE